jgi:hypothetical protein
VDAVAALLPSLGVGLLFWVAVRAMVNADRRERQAMAALEKQRRKATEEASGGESTPPAG